MKIIFCIIYLLILFNFLAPVYSDTDLVTIACKNAKLVSNVTNSTNNSTSAILSQLMNYVNGEFLAQMLAQESFEYNELVSEVLPVILPWAILLVIAIIIYIGFWANFSCMFCFKNHCLQYKACKILKNRGANATVLCCAIFFALGLIACSIVGFTIFRNAQQDSENATCSLVLVADKTLKGKDVYPMTWSGLSNIINNIDSLSNLLNNWTPIDTSLWLENADYAKTELDLIQNLDNMYKNYKNMQVVTPNPNGSISKTPDFISIMGPSTSSGTYGNQLKVEIQNRTNLIFKNSGALKPNVDFINSNIGDIIGNTQASKQVVVNTLQNVQSLEQSLTNIYNHVISYFFTFY